MNTKKCSKCGQIKDICLFSKNNKTKDKLHCSCKECDKEKYYKNREINILNMREYKKNNPEKLKNYYLENQDIYKKYRDSKKENTKSYMKEYYKNNLDRRKKYLENTKEERRIKRNIFEKLKRETDPLYKLKIYVRNRIGFYIKKTDINKRNTTFKLVGCSPLELKIYLEEKFIDGMSWENQGKWHIDHILPLSSATNEDELYKLCHFTNLQPMWATDNIRKGAKII
jgi:hypothetical protein